MKEIRAMVVDDEPLAREGIRVLLEKDEEVECVAECGDGREAVREIERVAPDLLFLDIQMPEMDGFEVLQALDEEDLPVVVFVTAYDEYAIRAFEVHALDYLLKPYDDDRFFRALDRVKAEVKHRRDTEFTERLAALLENRSDWPEARGSGEGRGAAAEAGDRIMVKSSGRIQFVSVEEIDWIEAAGDYVRLHTGERSHLLRETMKAMEERLDSDRFVRVHRSTIVKLDHVREVRSSDSGQYDVVLQDGTRRSLSRSGRERLEEALGSTL
jgi:two-component system LytT family response regulator